MAVVSLSIFGEVHDHSVVEHGAFAFGGGFELVDNSLPLDSYVPLEFSRGFCRQRHRCTLRCDRVRVLKFDLLHSPAGL